MTILFHMQGGSGGGESGLNVSSMGKSKSFEARSSPHSVPGGTSGEDRDRVSSVSSETMDRQCLPYDYFIENICFLNFTFSILSFV